MPTTPDAFTTDSTNQLPAGTPPTSIDAFADQLAAIKNEDGLQKYASVDEALKGAANAQTYIPQIKGELATKDATIATLQAELDKRASVEDVVSRLTAPTPQEPPATVTPAAAAGLDEDAAFKLFEKLSEQKERASALFNNRQKVSDALNAKFGENLGSEMAAKAAQLGTTPKALGDMASENPDVVLALFSTTAAPVAGLTNTSHNIPPVNPDNEPLKAPTKSLLSGSTSKEQAEFMRKIKADTYKKYGITQ